jgi:hypothetical protein
MGQISSRGAASTLRRAPTDSAAVSSACSAAVSATSDCGPNAAGIGKWHDELVRQSRAVHKVTSLTYEEFLANIRTVNSISSHFLDDNGKQLVFAVKRGSDVTLFWKATVRIACVKVSSFFSRLAC